MELQDYIDSISIQLTGGILESEIDDKGYAKIIDVALKELNRYYNTTRLLTLDSPETCIDLSSHPEINTVTNVFRIAGVTGATEEDARNDPAMMSQLQMYNLGSGFYSPNWVHRIAGYSYMQQISNTIATDLQWRQDKLDKKLYVTFPQGKPHQITLEYIPTLRDVSEVVGDYWSDMLLKLSLAYAKVALGRIRTRYTQTNAIWNQDGEKMLEEGTKELEDLREKLRKSNDIFQILD